MTNNITPHAHLCYNATQALFNAAPVEDLLKSLNAMYQGHLYKAEKEHPHDLHLIGRHYALLQAFILTVDENYAIDLGDSYNTFEDALEIYHATSNLETA